MADGTPVPVTRWFDDLLRVEPSRAGLLAARRSARP